MKSEAYLQEVPKNRGSVKSNTLQAYDIGAYVFVEATGPD